VDAIAGLTAIASFMSPASTTIAVTPAVGNVALPVTGVPPASVIDRPGSDTT
jgi:hypothetical protein